MRLGIVGAGEVAQRHAAAATHVDGLTFTAVTDPDADRARRLADQHGAHAVADLDGLLAEVDLVVLAVPHAYHADLSLRAAAAGCDVLVEKPMATTVEQCDRMIAQIGDRLHIGQQGRFFAQVSAARQELDRLGAPLLYLERRSTD
jgi:predicted dehydrogenase